MSSERRELLPISIAGQEVLVSVVSSGGEEDVASKLLSFDGVREGIQSLAMQMAGVFAAVKPNKASVEFEVSLALKSGQLSALFFDGEGSGGAKVALEWEFPATVQDAGEAD